MTGPESGSRAYVTAYTRAAEIRELYGREPTANEVRALAELPLEKYASKFHLDDNSEKGRRILWLLERSEQNRDVSLLEKAGELLMEQSTRLPAHWRSLPIPAPPLRNGLSDDAYQFSPMSNDPFAKVGFVKVAESKVASRYSPVPNEPQHTAYPDLLVNPPERWVRQSPKDFQPMRHIQPARLFSSYSWLDQQVQRQLRSPPISNMQKLPCAPVKPKPIKTTDPYRVHKPATNSKSKAHDTMTQTPISNQWSDPRTPQGLPQLPTTPINTYFLDPKWQKDLSRSEYNVHAYQEPYSSSANQTAQAVPTRDAHATVNPVSTPNPDLAVYGQFSPPPKTEPSTQTASRPIINQQPYNPIAHPLLQPPAIRTPTTPLIPSSQGHMPWLTLTSEPSKSTIVASESTETKSYNEVYRKAQETADNLAKMLGKK